MTRCLAYYAARPHRCLLAGCLALAAARPVLAGPEIPGQLPPGPVALVGATVHPVAEPDIAGGMLVFDQGKIVSVGPAGSPPEGAEIIDLAGQHVYPGLIDAYTDLGLIEIPSVRATRDLIETGTINPNVRAEVALNPDSNLIPVARANGVLAALAAPRGGLLRGTSALIELDGWTWEAMTVRAPVALHLAWARSVPLVVRLGVDAPELEPLGKHAAHLREIFARARAYAQAKQAATEAGRPAPDFDARWEAMIPVLERRLPVMIEADEVQQIQSAVDFARREQLALILLGGYDAPRAAELLKAEGVPVIVTGTHRLPQRREDPYDTPFSVPAQLQAAGVRFCLAGGVEASQVRNLAYQAATAAAFGLAPADALKSITLWPAEILGAGDRLGSLSPGKDATLIITDGDPLEAPTQVRGAYIQGRPVDLSSRQTRLYEKYREKYRRQGVAIPD